MNYDEYLDNIVANGGTIIGDKEIGPWVREITYTDSGGTMVKQTVRIDVEVDETTGDTTETVVEV